MLQVGFVLRLDALSPHSILRHFLTYPPVIFGFTPIGWMYPIALTYPYCIIYYGNILDLLPLSRNTTRAKTRA